MVPRQLLRRLFALCCIRIYFASNLSNFPYLDELEINVNWDIQGYLHDYLTVEFSFDDGISWNPISGNYGIPGLGVWHNAICITLNQAVGYRYICQLPTISLIQEG